MHIQSLGLGEAGALDLTKPDNESREILGLLGVFGELREVDMARSSLDWP